MEKWKTMPLEVPTDFYDCFVRLNYWFGAPFRATYSSAAKEWTSVENGLKYPIWSISRWKYDTDSFVVAITATGDGTGVSTLRMTVSENQTLVILNGNARFYTDAAGTLNESTTWDITTGALRTIYLKSNAGNSEVKFPKPEKVTSWGSSENDGWTSGTNAAKITVTVGQLALTQIRITGQCEIIGALPTGLIYLFLHGSLINWTYSGAVPTGLTYIILSGYLINWTYSGALPTGLTYLFLYGSLINWTYSSALPTGLNTLALNGNLIDWMGLDIGNNGNISNFALTNYRVAKMSSTDMLTLLNQMTYRTGTLPATVTINDYADYLAPPTAVTNAVALLKSTKSITTVNLGA